MNNPNSFDEEVQDATTANPDESAERTEETETPETPTAQGIDYEAKFKESAREAQRLYEENKRLQEQSNQKREEPITNPTEVSELFPGFEHLDEEAQRNLVAYTESVTKRTLENVYKDPDLQYVRTEAKEKRWSNTFEEVATELPDLKEYATDFRAKYYNPNVSADPAVIKELAKSYLYDKAKDIGANEERARADRVNLEDIGGGDKTPATSSRTLEEWTRMAQEKPAQFASQSKQFNEDIRKMQSQ